MAVEPRPSASVIVVRDAPAGLETFMVRRHARSPVAPSAYVFPSGTVRPDDLEAEYPPDVQTLADVLSARSDTPVESAQAAALYVAAVRELFEEAGVLLVRDAGGFNLRWSKAAPARAFSSHPNCLMPGSREQLEPRPNRPQL